MISIIMPYYKKRQYVKEAITSVLKQTFKNFELLIIYDDEDKQDIEFIKKIIFKDKRVKLIINNKNLGAGLSRNKGIKLAKGKLIAFIDCDDIWHIEKLKMQLKFMNDNKIKISHTYYKVINKNKKLINVRKSKKQLNYLELLKSCDIGLSTVILEKKLINNYFCFPDLKTKEDYVLWLKLAKKGYVFNVLNKPLSSWRKVKNSLSSSKVQKISDGLKVYLNFMNFNILKSFFYLIRLSIYSLLR